MIVAGPLAGLTWAAARLFGLLRAQVSWRAAVGPAWEAVAAVLALALALALAPAVLRPVPLAELLLVGACELLLGSVVGAVFSLSGQALLGAAGQSARTLQVPRSGLPLLLVVGGAAAGLAADLHRPLLLGLRGLMDVWRVGAPTSWATGEVSQPVAAAHAATVLALALATPVLLAAAVVDLAMRLATRGVALAAFDALRPWLVTVAASMALGAAWGAYPEAWGRAFGAP